MDSRIDMEETNHFYPHRRDDSAITNLPQNNPTYPTREELDGLLQNVQKLTDEAGRQAQAAGDHAKDAGDAAEFTDEAAKAAGETLRQVQILQEEINGTAETIGQHAKSITEAAGEVTKDRQATEDAQAWAAYYQAVAEAYAEGARSTPAPPGGATTYVPITGARAYCEQAKEANQQAGESAQALGKAKDAAIQAAAQTAADLEDVKAYHELMEENLGLVPAVAVDSAAVRDASRVLVGTDNVALTELIGEL
jgi:DNA repair exonuclease SbcCD ATPase subunit